MVARVLGREVARARDDRRASLEEFLPPPLSPVFPPHRARMPAPTAPRIVQREAARAEAPMAGARPRAPERLRPADARTVVIVVRVKDDRRQRQHRMFDGRICQPVGVDDVGRPLPQHVDRRSAAEIGDAPSRDAVDDRERGAIGRHIHLVQERQVVTGRAQPSAHRGKIGLGAADVPPIPGHDCDAHRRHQCT